MPGIYIIFTASQEWWYQVHPWTDSIHVPETNIAYLYGNLVYSNRWMPSWLKNFVAQNKELLLLTSDEKLRLDQRYGWRHIYQQKEWLSIKANKKNSEAAYGSPSTCSWHSRRNLQFFCQRLPQPTFIQRLLIDVFHLCVRLAIGCWSILQTSPRKLINGALRPGRDRTYIFIILYSVPDLCWCFHLRRKSTLLIRRDGSSSILLSHMHIWYLLDHKERLFWGIPLQHSCFWRLESKEWSCTGIQIRRSPKHRRF